MSPALAGEAALAGVAGLEAGVLSSLESESSEELSAFLAATLGVAADKRKEMLDKPLWSTLTSGLKKPTYP